MKMKTIFGLLILSSLTLTSCTETTSSGGSSGTTSNTGGGTTSGGDTGGGNTGGGNTGGGTGGNTGGGTGSTFPVYSFNILVAGEGTGVGGNDKPENTWKPYGNSSIGSPGEFGMPTISDAKYFFQSDSRMDLRFKLLPQPDGKVGSETCYGRVTGQAGDANDYTKVKFKVSLRDIVCSGSTVNDSCTLGNRYQTRTVGPLSVGSYSSVLQLGHLRNNTQHGTVVEVHEVKTDHTCQANNTYCPSEQYLRVSSCWEATMELSTDYTESF